MSQHLLEIQQKAGNDLKMELSSSFNDAPGSTKRTHPAGQTGLEERLVCGNELGVTQQGHRQLGCDADLKGNGSRKRSFKFGLRVSEDQLSHRFLSSCFTYQLLDPFGGGSRGVVVRDEQHLFKVFVSRGVGLGRPGRVLTLTS